MSTPRLLACWRWRCWPPCAGGSVWTGVVLAAATLTKFLPVGGAAGVLAATATGGCRSPSQRPSIAFYLPYAMVGWQVLGFLSGYASEEGFENGHGIFLLQLLGRVDGRCPAGPPLPISCSRWAALGLLGVCFAFGGNAAGSAGRAPDARRRVRR